MGRWRARKPPMPKIDKLTMVLMTTFWWWNFWHLFSDWEELFGPFGLEKAENWTDEELGIPPLE
ncbi:hypothetical protein RUM44_004501 [Polyplax serrata]|uniref:Uncharacterized protein n=1 Tax=Polyplax serrata TaxID=468196 RepID=A0ABR1B327_POLSC